MIGGVCAAEFGASTIRSEGSRMAKADGLMASFIATSVGGCVWTTHFVLVARHQCSSRVSTVRDGCACMGALQIASDVLIPRRGSPIELRANEDEAVTRRGARVRPCPFPVLQKECETVL